MPVNTPADVVDPIAAVSAAETEAASIDILVCGNCQSVFHFVEEFQEHKTQNNCEKTDKTSLTLQGSKKPQVWAFLIWKNSQQKAADQQGSWKLYQRWCNMPDSQRQSWVTAGRNIQAFINLSHARELNMTNSLNKDGEKEIEDEYEEDFVVEKIVGKRYNPKKKQIEYLLKWEGYPPEQNTWEPLSNLTTCKSLLQEYERTAAQQLNNKSPISRLPAVLRKDTTPTPVKLQSTSVMKPSGLIASKIAVERKVENAPALLQTQRKIVPATPLTNPPPPVTKLASPFAAISRVDAGNKTTTTTEKVPDVPKVVTPTEEKKDKTAESSPSSVSGDSSKTPLKKRVVGASPEESRTPVVPSLPSPSEQKSKNDQSKVIDQVKDWCGPISDDASDISSLKRTSDAEDFSTDEAKRIKLTDNNKDEAPKTPTPVADNIEIPRSGIFKKSDLREKYPSINNIFGKAVENSPDSNSKSEETKNDINKGLLKIDHSQMPELVSGLYKMTVKGGSAKIDLLSSEKSLSAVLPTMPGPKGGVVILGNRFDLSRIVKGAPKSVVSSPEKASSPRITDSPTFCGIFPRKHVEDSPVKQLKPDLQPKVTTSISDSLKKSSSTSLRKVSGTSLPRGKGRSSISSPLGVSRFKTSLGKSFTDSFGDSSNSRLQDSDGFVPDFCDFENSDAEEYALPDDFPEELDMEPLSPTRPLTLDPETGKRLMRAEGEPTPEPTPEPSPVPSPVPPEMLKQEQEHPTESENMVTGDGAGEETYAEINGSTYKVTNAGQVGLIQSAAFAQDEAGLKSIPIAGSLGGDENGEGTNMITITGEDGLVYQVANAKLEGDTIVVASGEDDQQCVFVTDDGHQVMQRTNEDGSTVLTLESAYADAVAQLVPNQVNILPDGSQIYVKQEENGQVELVQLQGAEMHETETAEETEGQISENADDNSGQVVAQLIEAGEPNPAGGPRRVVLLLPDGNLMVTEVDEEQFAALEFEK